MKTAVVSGALANKPFNGGEAWVRLSWVRGLAKLGWDVHFVEQISAATCVGKNGRPAAVQESANLAYFNGVVQRFGLGGAAALLVEQTNQVFGYEYSRLLSLAKNAELLINISGNLTEPAVFEKFGRKVFIDIDPGFTQAWHRQGIAGAQLGGHDAYYTIGENIGTDHCGIETCGIPWRATRQPVVLSDWPAEPATMPARFTTVATWRGPFGPVTIGDKVCGPRAHEFRKFLALPRHVEAPMELVLRIDDSDARDRNSLEENGWRLINPAQVQEPENFRDYIRGSAAEFSVAQGVYVGTQCGWFSDRTARYLACGKPVLVQETGFSRNLPVGEGLLSFRDLEEARRGAVEIMANYDRHSRAARRIAEQYFDSDKVLGKLLNEVFST
jgi:hypothetical protein